MVKVFALDIKEMPDPKESPDLLCRLSERRREKVLRCSKLKGRKEAAGAGILLKEVFRRYGIAEEMIYYGKQGKPECDGICFNVSHTEGLVLCAVSDRPVGCDVEYLRSDYGTVADRFFTQEERKYMEHLPEQERPAAFTRMWTIKESYIKMTGEGMSVPFSSLQIVRNDRISLLRDGIQAECYVKEYEVLGYRISVCAMEEQFDEEIQYINL